MRARAASASAVGPVERLGEGGEVEVELGRDVAGEGGLGEEREVRRGGRAEEAIRIGERHGGLVPPRGELEDGDVEAHGVQEGG